MSSKAWSLSILAVPVLYVLSVPPLAIAQYRIGNNPFGIHWVLAYCGPYSWVLKHSTPITPVLRFYSDWWEKIAPLNP